MKLGSTKDHALLRILGREQASFMIDAFKRDTDELFKFESEKRAQERQVRFEKMLDKALRMLPMILIGIALGALAYYFLK